MLRIFTIKQGDDFSFTVTFKNLTTDLTTFEMGIKKDYKDPMAITKSLNNGITKVSTGKYRIDIPHTETELLNPGYYIYDLRMSLGDVVFTPLYGFIIVDESVFE